ncbi:hypothetical protein NQ315_011973, partial [Exocentrus adspersus]
LNFMKRYGYIEEDNGESEALYSEDGISQIIKTMQRYGGIEETGRIDNATLKAKIILEHKTFIANWSPKLGEYKVVKNIQQALDTWGDYGRLRFQRNPTQDADIIVAFGTGYHGDPFPFDGEGNVLAHAFFPYEEYDFGGDIHFDADENWVDRRDNGSKEGTDFYGVALHELGHSLGLAHSIVRSSVMFPYYKEHDPNSPYQLDYDDILGMYKLYISSGIEEDGYTPSTDDRFETTSSYPSTSSSSSSEVTEDWYNSPTKESSSSTTEYSTSTTTRRYNSTKSTTPESGTSTVNTTVTYEGDDETVDDHMKHDGKHTVPYPNTPSLPNICDGYVDAVATLRNELFVFKGQYVWRYKDKGKLQPGYPVTIHQMFPQLPEDIKSIDAAYQRPDGNIVLFTGKTFWVHNSQRFIEDSPKPLTHYGLPEYLNDIDAVQTWGRNDRFWRYNEAAQAMDPGYPMHMERWRSVPENLDAANTWRDGVTYFFKGELFWIFDNNWVIATEKSPLPTAQVWFGCPEDEQQMKRLFS